MKQYTEDVKLLRVNAGINPMPGQFFEASILGFGECPLASCSHDKKHIDMLVRNVGNVTGELFNLKKGDSVFIRGPYGHGFPLQELQGKDLLFVAGGTGIAPVTSMIEYVSQNRKDFGKVEIYFGFRNEKYILLMDRISKWKKMFNVSICLDKHGYVHEVLGKKDLDLSNSMAILCGPEIMMKSVTEVLNKKGLNNDKIFWSMERRMECAMGSCGRCLIQDVYTCKDGPVFRYDFIKPRLENEEASNRVK